MFSNLEIESNINTIDDVKTKGISNSFSKNRGIYQSMSNQKLMLNEKMCALCNDFLTKSNQIQNWNEIFLIIEKCFKKNDPKTLLFGNEEIDNLKIKEHISKNGYQTSSLKEKNLSINNNCIIQ